MGVPLPEKPIWPQGISIQYYPAQNPSHLAMYHMAELEDPIK